MASSLRFFPNKIILLSNTTPSEISFDDLIKYFIIGIVPVIKSSPLFKTGIFFVWTKDNSFLLGFLSLIIVGGRGRNFVINSINLERRHPSCVNNISFDVSAVNS